MTSLKKGTTRHRQKTEKVASRSRDTGGEGAFTQWVHGEFIVISEAICPPNTHWVHAEYFSKEPINFLPLYPLGTG